MESWVELPDSDLEAGVLPVQIRKLVERRREVSRGNIAKAKTFLFILSFIYI